MSTTVSTCSEQRELYWDKKARRKHCTLQYYNNFLKAQDSHMLHKDLCSPTMIIFSVLSDNQAFNHPKSSKQS